MASDAGYESSIRTAMAELARNIIADTEIDSTLARVTASAVALIRGVDYADVMLVDGKGFRSVAPTDGVVTKLDATQMRLGEGPCLIAAVQDSVVRCADLRTEERWPAFAAASIEAGVLGVMSFQLFSHRGGAGALNLCSRVANAVDPEGQALGAILATHAATALAAASRTNEFRSALASRDLIGQAKGIIMNQFSLNAVRAFELMVRQSQDSNTPVRVVAQQIIDSYTGASTAD
ncbi:hypothetical protein MKUB_46530 [Mycobacterium kubicae]|uniref:ANTAR domain-containing protein n=3 Tax=Mycobacterium kubicae TaxID=120959 RepID=A0ABQ1BTV2_9MYCO|nr:hypothetical protein AWC13_08860 [Mycobacterium kubicae]GFG67163.1 hypothetical protein MKUB_46530 [Mycobacterium kubicae]